MRVENRFSIARQVGTLTPVGSDTYVIVTADDFGLAIPVNDAVEMAAREGVLTSASLMVGERAVADAVARARRMPALGVGLHVVVVDGRPVLPPSRVPALVDANGRLSDRLVRTGFRYFFSPQCRRQLRAEVRAQFEAFRATGLPLDHVDAHRHMHLHPTVLSGILAAAREFQVPAIRVPAEPIMASRGQSLWHRAVLCLQRAALAPWLALVRWRLRRAGIQYNGTVRGLADTGHMDEATVLRLVPTIGAGVTEMFFHPATDAPSPDPLPQPVRAHVAELEALCSPRVRARLEEIGARRGSWGEIQRNSVRR